MAHSVGIVVPVYNEQDNVGPLAEELRAALDPAPFTYQVLFVDDGSTDDTFDRLEQISATGPDSFGAVRLRRNFGQAPALAVGLRHPSLAACGVIVTLDGDLQNPPSEIPRLVETLAKGHDLVCGWRQDRADSFLRRRVPSAAANWLLRVTSSVPIHDFGCSLRAYDPTVLTDIDLRGELHRLLPAIVAERTSHITEIPVAHRPRVAGRSKYGIGRTMRVLLDMAVLKFFSSYAERPMHAFGLGGLLATLAGAVIWTYLLIERVIVGVGIADRPLVILGGVLLLAGIQLFGLGLLGEVITRQQSAAHQEQTIIARSVGIASPEPVGQTEAGRPNGRRDVDGQMRQPAKE
jgi:glycosyltransferase involved in cell wall biosynthesis